jgi:glutamate N-acetyltransferase/amino-acid N-acetyltransferase
VSNKPSIPVSPLAPKGGFPDLGEIRGVKFAAIEAGGHYKDRCDVMLAEMVAGTVIAGVFTKSATRSAAVLDCQEKIGGSDTGGAAILVNAGNANAFTGSFGQASVQELTEETADVLGISPSRVFSASTGVIGEPLPHERFVTRLDELKDGLSTDNIEKAARAIMTTDTFAKGVSVEVDIAGVPIRIAGFAKGSGMIAPDMATMLAYIFTDAKISQNALQNIVSGNADVTLNCITVDSDTSTSDTVLVSATGAAGNKEIGDPASDEGVAFSKALHGVMLELAHLVVRDGEGASKFIEVRVEGAASDSDARKVALSIANSPLVKTAISGEDPNWGRIVMAVGKSGARADRDSLAIWFGDILVAENGWVAPSYTEQAGANYMKQDNLFIRIGMGLGQGQAVVWTCDLTHGYININTDYRS